MPRVSVVMRTKDRPAFVARAFRDLAAQRFTDWELLLVNDGGDPAPLAERVAAAPAAVRDRIRLVEHAESQGMEAASNAALEIARGEFVVVHDDDDTWHPRFLERTVEVLDAEPGTAGVVVRTTIVWEQIESDGSFTEIGRDIAYEDTTEPLLSDLIRLNRWVPISFLYRRELHDRVGPYRSDLAVVGDWEFNLRVLASGAHLRFLADEPLAFWHQRPGVTGVAGNSVIDGRAQHRRADARLRDEYLRAYVEREGLGLPLYLATLLAEQREELAEQQRQYRAELDELRRLLADATRFSPSRLLLRAARRVRRIRRGGSR